MGDKGMRHSEPEGALEQISQQMSSWALSGGLAAAYTAIGLTFRGPQRQFWNRMTLTGLTLGGLALVSEEDLRHIRFGPKDLAVGISSAGVLYGVFVVGNKLARVILPRGGAEIALIYDLGIIGKNIELAARLALVIGPAEELFWRGLIQKRLIERYGPLKGAVLGTAAYAGAHLVTGNVTLIGAASIAGAFWGGLHALGVPISSLIVSHAVWDVLTFLIAPIAPPSGEG